MIKSLFTGILLVDMHVACTSLKKRKKQPINPSSVRPSFSVGRKVCLVLQVGCVADCDITLMRQVASVLEGQSITSRGSAASGYKNISEERTL